MNTARSITKQKRLSPKKKELLDKAVKKTVKTYHKTLRLLAQT